MNAATQGTPVPSLSNALTRLLTILPGSREDLVVCYLEVVDLSELALPPYEAVSYVWGVATIPKDLIIVNKAPFAVSTILLEALLHLRNSFAPRTVWIDAICVNQNDDAERSSQVLLMPKIYITASRVVIWLGKREPWGLRETFTSASNNRVDSIHKLEHGCGDYTWSMRYGMSRVMDDLL